MATKKIIGSTRNRKRTVLSHKEFNKLKYPIAPRADKRAKMKDPDAYAKWINSFDWDHFITFTTGYKMTLPSARRAMKRVHSIYNRNTYEDDMIKGGMRMFWVAEPFDLKEGFHTHALTYYYDRELQLMSHMGMSQDFYEIKNAWTQAVGSSIYGDSVVWDPVKDKAVTKKGGARVDIQKYQKDLGANFYVAKYLFKHRSDYGMLQSETY